MKVRVTSAEHLLLDGTAATLYTAVISTGMKWDVEGYRKHRIGIGIGVVGGSRRGLLRPTDGGCLMSSSAGRYTTKELSKETWPAFERLFSQGGGWDFCGCMLYQRGYHHSGKVCPTRAAAHARNLQEKRELVEQGGAHGILSYAGGEPVGWCQYGPVDELPIPGGGKVEKRVRVEDPASQWRVTCFVTHKQHRRKGIAGIALAAAVEAIREQGGGWVEATPIAHSHYDGRYHQIVNTYGRDSAELQEYLETWPTRVVRGVGPVPATRGSFGGVSHPGTVSMFERQGFEAVKIVRDTYVLMRRHV